MIPTTCQRFVSHPLLNSTHTFSLFSSPSPFLPLIISILLLPCPFFPSLFLHTLAASSRGKGPRHLLNSKRLGRPHSRSVNLLLTAVRNEFLTRYIKHDCAWSPFSGVTQGRNHKRILCESRQQSCQLTTQQAMHCSSSYLV